MRLFWKILKWGIGAVLLVLVFILLINFWVVRSTASSIYTDPKKVPAKKVAVLLGTSARVSSGYRNLFFTYRMDAAARLYKAGKIKKIIVSGDNGDHRYDETTDMKNALIQRGIPASAIVEDFAGFRTLDSVFRARSVFGQDSFIIVSQKFHLERALFIAQRYGLDAVGFVAKDPPHNQNFQKIMLREYMARVKAVLDCYVLGTQPKFSGPPEPIQF